MGLACPVCEIPHQDATHLANHLAFTAMTHGDDHEAWLDDHVPAWAESGEAELAGELADLAPEAAYEQVFEDTVHAHSGGDGAHKHGDDAHTDQPTRQQPDSVDPEAAAAAGGGTLDEEARAILDEARGLTAAMLDDDGEPDEDSTPGSDSPDS